MGKTSEVFSFRASETASVDTQTLTKSPGNIPGPDGRSILLTAHLCLFGNGRKKNVLTDSSPLVCTV